MLAYRSNLAPIPPPVSEPRCARRVIGLTYRPHLEPGGYHLDRFSVWLDGEMLLKATRSPLYEGARELLRRGFDPDRLMTIRLEGRDYDSFAPATVGHLARWSISERDRGSLQRIEWRPFIRGSLQDGREGIPAVEGVSA